MSHKRDPSLSGGGHHAPSLPHRLFYRLQRHVREWPGLYVEMRAGVIEDRSS